MDVVVIISQALLYTSFALLTGSFILLLVPPSYRPALHIRGRLLTLCTISLPLLALFPVLSIALYIAPRLGFLNALNTVLTTYTIGTAWLAMFACSVLLLIVLKLTKDKLMAVVGILLTILAMLTIAWSSHAAAYNIAVGIISDFLHILAVSVWVGILLIIGWCSTNSDNWLAFLKWFSLVAISCFSLAALSGVLLMDILVDGYIQSWPIAYGQGLLIKHLFLIPLVFFALANAFLVKFKLSRDTQFNPLHWIRAEGMILLAIFTMTAFFSQQSPPHAHVLTEDAISPLFRLFYGEPIDVTGRILFFANPASVGLFFGALLSMALTVVSIVKKAPIWLSVLFSCCIVGCLFSMVMFAIKIM